MGGVVDLCTLWSVTLQGLAIPVKQTLAYEHSPKFA